MWDSSRKKVFIRTDANKVIASGHVMRCLSIADALFDLGLQVEFVMSDSCAFETIRRRGYDVSALDTDWRSIEEGADLLERKCLELSEPATILVDTYSITRPYVDRLARCAKICYLGSKRDDLGNLSLLANYSTDIDTARYEELYLKRGTALLLGPRYAPLKKRFSSLAKTPSETIDRVLLTTGSTDPHNFISEFLRAVKNSRILRSLEFEVVVGQMFEFEDEIEHLASQEDNIRLHRKVEDMAGLMATVDVAVSACGTTVYELAAVGLPVVTFAMVDEQVASAESLARLGVVAYSGLCYSSKQGVLNSAISKLEDLVATPEKAAVLATKARSLIDGKGAQRIAKELAEL